MAFRDCLNNAVSAGEISAEDAAELGRQFDDHVHAARATDDPRGAEAVGKESLERELRATAERRERVARLQAERTAALDGALAGYRTPGGKADIVEAIEGVLENRNAKLAGLPSVVGRREALTGLFHGRLEELLYRARRSFGLGLRDQADLRNVVKAAFGDTTNAEAKAFYDAYGTVLDESREAFNLAGGDIRKREDYRVPQSHDAHAIARTSEDDWVRFTRDQLDIDAMRDPLTGGPLSPDRLDEALRVIYSRIVTDGSADLVPSAQGNGRGSLANQRQEERFLVFRDADAWLAYNQRFGGNDVHRTLFEHFHGMAKDIAAMEILGPNPNATVEWMKQVLEHEVAQAALNKPSLYAGASGAEAAAQLKRGAFGGERIDRLWRIVNGSAGTGAVWAADLGATVRNTLSAAQLAGAAVTAVASDPFQQRLAASFAGIPRLRMVASVARMLMSRASGREVTRAGIIFSDAMEHLGTDLRRGSVLATAHEASKWLPDRTFAWTGLTPWTRMMRRADAFAFMFTAGDHAGKTLAQMRGAGGTSAKFARWLEGHGIDEAAWDVVRSARGSDHGEAGRLLRPVDVAALDPELGRRYGEAVHSFMEEATPEGTSRARAMLARDTKAGTLSGEVMRSSTSYLVFPSTMMLSLTRMVAHEAAAGGGGAAGAARGAGFLASAVLGLTAGGVIAEQLYHLRNGRDPMSVKDPTLWGRGFIRGGALGFYGDYVLGDYKRGAGESVARFAGPVAGFGGELMALLNAKSLAADEDANRGRQAVRMLRNYTPFARMWWVKPATDRILFDRMQALADPKAHSAWQRESRRIFKETGQQEWWRRGEATPARGPDWGKLAADR